MQSYTVGQAVFVYSLGAWYAGTVDKVTEKRVFIDYTTGSGTRRVKPYSITDDRVSATPPNCPIGKKAPRHAQVLPGAA